MAISRFYIPTPGQTDADTRATALGAKLAASTLINDLRYSNLVAPVVVLDNGWALSSVSDSPNTTLSAVNLADTVLTGSVLPVGSSNLFQQATPASPIVGSLRLYADLNNKIWIIDSNGNQTELGDVVSELTLQEILIELKRISLALQILINEDISYDDVPSRPSEG